MLQKNNEFDKEDRVISLILVEDHAASKPHKYGLLQAIMKGNCLSTDGFLVVGDNLETVMKSVPSYYIEMKHELMPMIIGESFRRIFADPRTL